MTSWYSGFQGTRVAESTLREMAVLPLLGPTLPVPAPDFHYAAPNARPLPFGGYTLVPGVPLSDARRAANAGSVAEGIGGFLTALHSFPITIAQALGVPGGTAEQWREEYAAFRDMILPTIAPNVSDDERHEIVAAFDRFLDDDRHFTFTPVLLHRDLVDEHILVEGETGTLSGVIDFEDMSIGDPAFDFTGIAHLGPAAVTAYRGPVDAGFAERIRFYRWLMPLHEVQYGVDEGNIHVRQ